MLFVTYIFSSLQGKVVSFCLRPANNDMYTLDQLTVTKLSSEAKNIFRALKNLNIFQGIDLFSCVSPSFSVCLFVSFLLVFVCASFYDISVFLSSAFFL